MLSIRSIVVGLVVAGSAHAFTLPSRQVLPQQAVSSWTTLRSGSDSADALRNEIEEMRQEAVQRLAKLNEKASQQKDAGKVQVAVDQSMMPAIELLGDTATELKDKVTETRPLEDETAVLESMTSSDTVPLETTRVIAADTTEIQKQDMVESLRRPVDRRDPNDLLDGTHWRLAVNIGRENGKIGS